MDNDTVIELYRIRHSVAAMRQWMTANLDAVEAQIDALLPREAPAPPHSWDVETVMGWLKGNREKA